MLFSSTSFSPSSSSYVVLHLLLLYSHPLHSSLCILRPQANILLPLFVPVLPSLLAVLSMLLLSYPRCLICCSFPFFPPSPTFFFFFFANLPGNIRYTLFLLFFYFFFFLGGGAGVVLSCFPLCLLISYLYEVVCLSPLFFLVFLLCVFLFIFPVSFVRPSSVSFFSFYFHLSLFLSVPMCVFFSPSTSPSPSLLSSSFPVFDSRFFFYFSFTP